MYQKSLECLDIILVIFLNSTTIDYSILKETKPQTTHEFEADVDDIYYVMLIECLCNS